MVRPLHMLNPFIGTTKHLYNWLCPSVGGLVGLTVGRVTHLLDDPHVAPYWPTWPCITVDENDRTYWMTMETFFYVIPNPFPDDGNTGTNGDF